MKSIKTIIGALLLTLGAIGIASCSQEEDNAVMQEKGNLLKIRTSVADTRGVITGTTFQKGDEIGICVTTIDGHDYTGNSQNIRATYTGSDWELERDVELTDDEAIVYAYYPYSANATDSIDIYLNPTTIPEQTDYLQGSCQGVSINNTTANIRFNHVLTRITLAITKGANDVGEGKISRARIENGVQYYKGNYVGEQPTMRGTKIATRGKMSIKTGKNRKITSEEEYFVEVPVNCTISSSEIQNIDILLLPVSYPSMQISTWTTSDIDVILTIDGEEYKFPLQAVPYSNRDVPEGSLVVPDGYSWEAGQQYTYPITISRNTVPTPEPTVGEAVYMGFDGDNGEPLYWSSWNLGATSPEDYGGLYGWGDKSGELTSTNLNYYPSANPPTDISGSGFDLARLTWGGGWRIPSGNEFWSLKSHSEVEWTYVNGVEGVRYTSTVNGNTIFIPMAPMRIGESVEQGNQSYYWLGTLNEEDPTMAGTFYIDSYWDNDWPTAGQPRYYGLPIRPVTEQP